MPSLTTHELDAAPWIRVESTLMSTARLVREAFDTRLAPLGLNLTQASLIAYVVEFGPTTQVRLADHLSIGRASIGSVIDQLERRRLVERRPNPSDRRVWLVAPTDVGRSVAADIQAADEELRAELRRGIGREERQALAWVMTRLQQNLRAAIDRTPAAAETSDSAPVGTPSDTPAATPDGAASTTNSPPTPTTTSNHAGSARDGTNEGTPE